ncbi:carbon-nitrogen hydrolase family protein [Caldicellulosiruptoraceae bacterium PP1]
MIVAAAQISINNSIEKNFEKIVSFIDKAKENSCDIICFPEMSLTGYNKEVLSDINLNNKINNYLYTIQEISNKNQIAVIIGYGYIENGSLKNRAGIILPNKDVVTYDKINLTNLESQFFSSGEKVVSFEYKGVKCGVIICRDQNYPLITHKLQQEGVKVLFILTAHYYNPKEARWKIEKNRAIPITRAVENKFYVVLANTIGTHIGMISLGNSLIIEPEGNVVVSAGESEEALLCYELQMTNISQYI